MRIFNAMVCAQSDDSHCSAQNRSSSSISRAERKPARFAMDQYTTRGIARSALSDAVKQIRYTDGYFFDRMMPLPANSQAVSDRPHRLVPTESVVDRMMLACPFTDARAQVKVVAALAAVRTNGRTLTPTTGPCSRSTSAPAGSSRPL
jgi:hypothetical protein